MINNLWIVPELDDALVQNLAETAGITDTVARILINRGITTVEDVHEFLSPSLDQLHDPMLMPDMEAGVERTAKAIANKEKILIHGDYDVDGVTSTALLVRSLSKLGAEVTPKVPHRMRDGYDIKPATIDEAHKAGVKLIITADCGVTAIEAAKRAKALGIDLIITDHHEQGETLPDAVAVINPRRHDSKYPFPFLAGVGVALKFAQALVRRIGYDDKKFVERYLDLTALGTVADVMPLLGENRVITKFGLDSIATSKKIGIRSILDSTGLLEKPMSTHGISFVLAPRINAVGRLGDASLALQLLLTSDRSEADQIVGTLEKLNLERQQEQARIFEEAKALLDGKDIEATRAIVLSSSGWNSGIVGIVASKVVEQYGRPTILLCVDEAGCMASGSARSIEVFNMIEALDECREMLERAGGHAMAAGLSLKVDMLELFETKLNEVACGLISAEDLIPKITVDGKIDASEVTWELLNQISLLEPFGHANPEPIFVSSELKVVESRKVGAEGTHLKMRVQSNGHQIDCIAFGHGDKHSIAQLGLNIDLCYNIRSNSYNGNSIVQLTVKDIKQVGGSEIGQAR